MLLMLNILLIADIVSKIISLVIFVCLAMYGQQDACLQDMLSPDEVLQRRTKRRDLLIPC